MARRIVFAVIVVTVFVAVFLIFPSGVKSPVPASIGSSNSVAGVKTNASFVQAYRDKQNAVQSKQGALDPDGPEPQWRTDAHAYLFTNDPEPEKAKKYMESLPSLPPEGQIEITEFWTRLVTDAGYSYTSNVVVNPATPEAVASVLMRDLLTRDNELKLPIILQVAKTPSHPMANEALEVLEATLHQSYGVDWKQWDAGIKNWLVLTKPPSEE